jgi:agmatinase
MKLTVAKRNFLGIDNVSVDKADVVIIPFGLEKTVKYGKKGTKNGPEKIIKISPNLEYFDEELEKEVYKEVSISTLESFKIKKNHEQAIGQIEEIVDEVYRAGKFPFVLGGEHSLTLGPVKSALKKFGRISILQFDAHADLRDEYEGTIYNHASVMRQCLKLKGIDLIQIGIRNISTDTNEFGFWEDNQDRIKTFWAKDMKDWKIEEMINSLGDKVYLTFDFDAFDSGLMPSVSTPEPGGLSWYQAIDIIRAVSLRREIVGADAVELSPIKGLDAPDFLAAKLVYKIIGYILAK